MKTIITADEVIKLAFASSPGVGADAIEESMIVSAQQKFIRPVVGGLYPQLEGGELPELLNKYIKPALAYYVKLVLLPVLATSVGSLGVVTHKSANFSAADKQSLSALRKSTRDSARTLLTRAVEHIEENSELYPEYDASRNVMKRVSLTSGVVL